MGSIFNVSFVENERRLNKANGTSEKANPSPGKTFAELLREVSTEEVKPSDNNNLGDLHATPSNISGGIISNLEISERRKFETHLPSILKGVDGGVKRGAGGVISHNVNVNIQDTGVKKVVTGHERSQTPAVPQLVSARSFSEGESASIKPQLLSAKRVAAHYGIDHASLPHHKLLDTTQPGTSSVRSVEYSNSELEGMIKTAGKFHGIDPKLGVAIARAESGLRPTAVSKDGHQTKGLFQLLDQTGQDMLEQLRVGSEYDPFDPALNSYLGVGYLRKLHDIFSQETILAAGLQTKAAKTADDLEKLAIAAFNAGEGNVARAQQKAVRAGKDPSKFSHIEPYLPLSTRTYVTRVARLRNAEEDDSSISKLA